MTTGSRRGKLLEAFFFHKQDAALMSKHERLEKKRRTREELENVSGIKNHRVLDTLVELDVTPAVLASLIVIPLVEVAWADGKIQEKEREAILKAAGKNGMDENTVNYELLETWLNHRPPKKLLQAWMHYICGLCETMSEEERASLRTELLSQARAVAEAAGGFLGLTSKISLQEQAILDEMASAFS